MKIIYNDRKKRLNWGARSTGKALYQVLIRDHEIIGDFDTPVYFVLSRYEVFQNAILNKYNYWLFRLILSFTRNVLSKFTNLTTERKVIFNDVDKTADALLKYKYINPYLNRIIEDIKICDALIINGEGSMIFGNPTRPELFFYFALIKIAKNLGKKTFYINAIASKNSVTEFNEAEFESFKHCFDYCNKVVVRDKFSMDFLQKHNAAEKAVFCPDSLFTWVKYIEEGLKEPSIGDLIVPFPDEVTDYGIFDFSKPYICIGGSSYFWATGSYGDFIPGNTNYNEIIDNYVNLVNKIKRLGMTIFFVESCSKDAFLYEVSKKTKIPVIPSNINLIQAISILANARVFISGRYHPSIMASLGGTPCVFMNSNSHKTYSVQFLLEYKKPRVYSPMLSDEIIENIYDDCKQLLIEGEILRSQIRSVVKKLSYEANQIGFLLNE
jgi:polysaccharide pyruvyl transferase WcaK-like protein